MDNKEIHSKILMEFVDLHHISKNIEFLMKASGSQHLNKIVKLNKEIYKIAEDFAKKNKQYE